MNKPQTKEIAGNKINSNLETLKLLIAEKELPLGKEDGKLAGEIIYKIRRTGGELKKIHFYVDALDFVLAEKECVLGKEGMAIVESIIQAIGQSVYKSD